MQYCFYGWEDTDVRPVNADYERIADPCHLYDLLGQVWSEDTCAPGLRPGWSEQNKTLGQCSITAFLVQEIFGGEVYGVPLPGGGVHCYNVVDGHCFDLTSEQFGDQVLCYTDNPVQRRETHFADADKYRRFLKLRAGLRARLT